MHEAYLFGSMICIIIEILGNFLRSQIWNKIKLGKTANLQSKSSNITKLLKYSNRL